MDLRAPDVGFDVAILAGGQGTRLKARTGALPKPLVPVLDVPLLDYQVTLCRRHGFGRILLLVHYAHEEIRTHLGDGERFGVRIGYQVETRPRGTAGALADALPSLDETFLVLYGDTFLDVDLRRMWSAHAAAGGDATLFVHPNNHPHDSDLVAVDDSGLVTALYPARDRNAADRRNLVNAGLAVMTRGGLAGMAPGDSPSDLARDVIPAMLHADRRVAAYRSAEYIKDVGTPERLERVEADIRAGVPERLSGRSLRSSVFLDRDGTINREVDRLRAPDQMALIDGAGAAVRRLNGSGHLAVVITNQSVVARGEVTSAELDRIHGRLDRLLGEAGAYVDATYVCPHHPDGGFPGEVAALKVRCDCRKPNTGLLDAACRELQVDRRSSWFVGDTTRDIEAGRRAGLRTVLVRTGHAGQDGAYPLRPDYVTADLASAVSWILDGHPLLARRMAPVALAALDARLVLIGGHARSGKSFAAQVLKESMAAFGRAAHVLSLDSWLKPTAERAEGTGVTSRFDTRGVVAAIAPIVRMSGRHSLQVGVYDRARRTMCEKPVEMSIGPDDLVIVEGVPALLIPELVALAAVRVHSQMPEPKRIALLHADYAWRGTSPAAVDALLASRALDEWKVVEHARTHATLVLDVGAHA